MSENERTRRTTSSMQLSALARELEAHHVRITKRLRERVARGTLDVSDTELDAIVRGVMIDASDLATDAYRAGKVVGAAEAALASAREESSGGT